MNQATDTIQEHLETQRLWIDQRTPSRLVIKQQLKRLPYAFLVLWSLLFAGIPMGLVVWVSSQIGISTLACQRNETASFDCDGSTRKFLGLGHEVEQQRLTQVMDARLDSAQWSNGQGGGTEKMWVTLSNQSEHIRIFETAYAIESGFQPTFQATAAAEIKRLLASDVNHFVIEDDQRLSGQFLGVLGLATPFVLLSLGVAYGGLRSRMLILDKAHNLYTYQVKTLLGTRVKRHALHEITSITIKERRHHRNGRLCCLYRLELSLKSNKKHRLPSMYHRETISKILVQMQSFIRVS